MQNRSKICCQHVIGCSVARDLLEPLAPRRRQIGDEALLRARRSPASHALAASAHARPWRSKCDVPGVRERRRLVGATPAATIARTIAAAQFRDAVACVRRRPDDRSTTDGLRTPRLLGRSHLFNDDHALRRVERVYAIEDSLRIAGSSGSDDRARTTSRPGRRGLAPSACPPAPRGRLRSRSPAVSTRITGDAVQVNRAR